MLNTQRNNKLRMSVVVSTFGLLMAIPMACAPADEKQEQGSSDPQKVTGKKMETATFGGGCFWCTEAVFQQIKGVKSVRSGYCGGHVENPTYEQVCAKTTGHAEVIQIEYDSALVKFEKLLEVHWKSHDPTTPNRQGNDVGPQYRSAIFYHSEKQKELAETYKKKLDESGAFGNPIVTEITPAATFYAAENYHQNYYKNNPSDGYCSVMIPPKIAKIRKVFADDLKDELKTK